MAAWCAENLRGVEAWKSTGCRFSTTSDESTKMFDGLLRQLMSYGDCGRLDGFEKTMERMLSADPEAIIPRTFKCGMDVVSTQTSPLVNPELAKEMETLEKEVEKRGTDWEKKHVKAVKQWGEGHWIAAIDTWNKLVNENPHDILAVKMAHDGYFFQGNSKGIVPFMEKVLPKWDETMPSYSFLHGMYAFGLEESGQYVKAEEHALKALKLNPYDTWATHARAHVLEMNGRFEEGIKFLEGTKEYWVPGYMLATHNFWHTAVYYIQRGDFETPLAIFDDEIKFRTQNSSFVLDYVDAASLLLRMELQGVKVGDRWKELPSMESHVYDQITAFNDCHFGPAFWRRGELEAEKKMHDSLINFTKTISNDNAKINEIVGLNLYEGLSAFCNEKYDEAVEKIYPVRKEIYRIGGSNAQRDVFTQVLIESCIQSNDEKNWKLAMPLLEERALLKSGEMPVAERLALKFKEKHSE